MGPEGPLSTSAPTGCDNDKRLLGLLLPLCSCELHHVKITHHIEQRADGMLVMENFHISILKWIERGLIDGDLLIDLKSSKNVFSINQSHPSYDRFQLFVLEGCDHHIPKKSRCLADLRQYG